jgi:hypothetical protein
LSISFKHTQQLVLWESGVATGAALQANKDIWIFEAFDDSAKLTCDGLGSFTAPVRFWTLTITVVDVLLALEHPPYC